MRLVAPAGEMGTLETPHTAAGPALRELIVGSEGTLGVIPDVTVRVRPAPDVRRYEAWIAEDFESGAEIVRSLAQGPGLPGRDPGLRRGGDLGLADRAGPARPDRRAASGATSACAAAPAAA